jgi:hypothetical protein
MELKVAYEEENGIIRFKMPEEAWDIQFSEEIGERFLEHLEEECSGVERRLLLVDLRGSVRNRTSREFRKWMREHTEEMRFERTAVIIDSPVMKTLGKFIMTSIGKLKNTQFFNDEENALAWLKESK